MNGSISWRRRGASVDRPVIRADRNDSLIAEPPSGIGAQARLFDDVTAVALGPKFRPAGADQSDIARLNLDACLLGDPRQIVAADRDVALEHLDAFVGRDV